MDETGINAGDYLSDFYRRLGGGKRAKINDVQALMRVASIADENGRLRQIIESLLELIDKHTDLPAAAANSKPIFFSEPPYDIFVKDSGLHFASVLMARARDYTSLEPGRESRSYRAKYEWKKSPDLPPLPPASPSLCASPPCGDGEMGGQKNTP